MSVKYVALTAEQRLANVSAHVTMLTDILSRQAPPEAQQRIYRARAIIDDDFIVITLLQNLPSFVPVAGQPDVKIQLFVDRPYTKANAGQPPIIQMMLVGQYAMDEIVSFLALDKVAPDDLEWIDETKYSSLVVVGDILRKLR